MNYQIPTDTALFCATIRQNVGQRYASDPATGDRGSIATGGQIQEREILAYTTDANRRHWVYVTAEGDSGTLAEYMLASEPRAATDDDIKCFAPYQSGHSNMHILMARRGLTAPAVPLRDREEACMALLTQDDFAVITNEVA